MDDPFAFGRIGRMVRLLLGRLSDELERTLSAYPASIHVEMINENIKLRSNLVEAAECEKHMVMMEASGAV